MIASPEARAINQVSAGYYSQQSAMSDPGHYRALFTELQNEVRSLARIIHGLGVYDVIAKDFYGCDLTEERQREIHIRSIEKRLDRIMALDDCPLSVARPPDKRIAGRCNSYTLMLVSMLRANGVPARSRCGFGAYFNPPKFEDHWVCEYWDADRRRWALADAQLDAVWCEKIRLSFDACDVPGPGATLDGRQRAFFDRLSALAFDPDANLGELRQLYEDDADLRVPTMVFNALLQRPEAL
jgi:hypothetical protein